MLSDLQRRALWGDLFEAGAKRGCLALLQARGLLAGPAGPAGHLRAWRATHVGALRRHLHEQTDAVDPGERRRLDASLDHLLVAAWGLGWTVLRQYLARFAGERLQVSALLCPLELPDRRRPGDGDPLPRVEALWRALRLDGQPDTAWAARGEPANADLLLLAQAAGRRHLLCLEFSLHAPPEAEDFAEERAHLDELERYVRRLESRGVFTRIAAEVAGDRFAFSDALVSHLAALTAHDRPLYKLCQGCSYATRLLHLLARRGQPLGPATAQVVAVTNAGIEALCATLDGEDGREDGQGDGRTDPRARLMTTLGAAYRRLDGGGEEGASLDREVRAVQAQIARSLPPALRGPFAEAFAAPPASRRLDVRLRERVTGFLNPADARPRDALLRWVADAPEDLAPLLGGPPRETVAAALDRATGGRQTASLRELHAAAITAGLGAAPRGRVSVVAAEGHPGIGKTTAVVEYLRRRGAGQGYLWLYTSPRTAINTEVTRAVARDRDGRATGVLALTTSQRLIHGAQRWRQVQPPAAGGAGRRFVDAAVVADGVAELRVPDGSTLFLTPELAQQIDEDYASSGFRKDTWDERRDVVRARAAPGVLATLARAARACLDANPALTRLVLTAAVQGFRARGETDSTVDRLSALFRSAAETPQGRRERRALAERVPTVLVMVDEIAGDGAGAPFVHALAAWLDRELVRPFAGAPEGSPFTVVLVLADASLANDVVLGSYLQHVTEAPEKVLVSESRGPRPFRLAGGALRLGGRRLPALHVMADGFPAGALDVEYRVRLSPVARPARADGPAPALRAAIREQHGGARLQLAVEEVFGALATIPPDEQVILFAQDRQFLRAVRQALLRPEALAAGGRPVETRGLRLREEEIGVLDSGVPEGERRRLLREEVRDAKRVFLMTSSGARGVSFPLATVLLAFVPTFAVESGFMELAQLVYRGRGSTRDPRTGARRSGDALDRRLVLLLQDFVPADGPIDDRQWLRRTVDLVSALVLLRATILTRITGDAGIPGQRAAVVPVGRVGTDGVGTGLSRSVAALLREGRIYLRDTVPAYLRSLVDGAARDTEAAFTGLRWSGTPRDRGRRSVAVPAVQRALTTAICEPAAPLLPIGAAVALPDAVYGMGPIWLERWSDVPAEEAFRFPGSYAQQRERLRRLLGACGRIARRAELPGALRRAARDLESILQRPEALLGTTFVAGMTVDSDRVWICLPVDYERLCALPPGEEGEHRRFRLEDPEHWLDALVRATSAGAAVAATHPVLPHFEGAPFLAAIAQGDPTGLERAFDDRYFMASSELNLLNTMLFVAESSPSSPGSRPER